MKSPQSGKSYQLNVLPVVLSLVRKAKHTSLSSLAVCLNVGFICAWWIKSLVALLEMLVNSIQITEDGWSLCFPSSAEAPF